MTGARIRAVVVMALMALAVIGANAWRPTQHLSDQRPKIDLEAVFPQAFGDWKVDTRMPVQLVSPDTQALLNKIYNQTLSRTYVNAKGDRIMLSVAYGGDQSDGTRAHRPEVCYPAQGFAVGSIVDGVAPVPGVTTPMRRLVAKLGGRIEPISYWIVVGETIALSGTSQKLAQLKYSMKGVIPDGLLMRVSSIDADSSHAFKTHEQFIGQMHSAIAPDVRSRFFGAPGSVAEH